MARSLRIRNTETGAVMPFTVEIDNGDGTYAALGMATAGEAAAGVNANKVLTPSVASSLGGGGVSVLAYAENDTYNNAPYEAPEIIASPAFVPTSAYVYAMIDFGGASFHDPNSDTAAIQIKVNGVQVAEKHLYTNATGGNRGMILPIWLRVPVSIGVSTVVSVEASTNADAVVVGDVIGGQPRYPYSITVLG